MKIYDCFIFFNENLLTEIRFNILDKFVDYFVVCESYYDHRGNKKGYLFDLNKFKKFNDKIIYVQIDEFPEALPEMDCGANRILPIHPHTSGLCEIREGKLGRGGAPRLFR